MYIYIYICEVNAFEDAVNDISNLWSVLTHSSLNEMTNILQAIFSTLKYILKGPI